MRGVRCVCVCFKFYLCGRGGAGAPIGAETPGEERGPRRAGDQNLVQTHPQILAALQSDKVSEGIARCPGRVPVFTTRCWPGGGSGRKALVCSRESQGWTHALHFGEELSCRSWREWGFRAFEQGSGEIGDQCDCSLCARTAWCSAAAFLISHTFTFSLLSPNAVPGPTPTGTLTPPSPSLSADRGNVVNCKPPSPHPHCWSLPGSGRSLSQEVALLLGQSPGPRGGRPGLLMRPGGCRDSRSDGGHGRAQ